MAKKIDDYFLLHLYNRLIYNKNFDMVLNTLTIFGVQHPQNATSLYHTGLNTQEQNIKDFLYTINQQLAYNQYRDRNRY